MNEQEKSSPFTDTSFPPEMSSLVAEGCDDDEKAAFEDWTFVRPSEAIPGDISLFSGIDPGDIKQGQIGDCWLMAGISAVAEWPHRIKKLFDNRTIQSSGAYTIDLFVMGFQIPILIDDYLPVKGEGEMQRLVVAHSQENELWVSLVEKAFAKLTGCYYYLSGGFNMTALIGLTGAPVFKYRHETIEIDEL